MASGVSQPFIQPSENPAFCQALEWVLATDSKNKDRGETPTVRLTA